MRCFGEGDPLYAAYHDHEWGRPVIDERGLLESICLEGFQAGLSWRLVLGRRAALRQALCDFEPAALAAFSPQDIDTVLALPGVIRHRGKIAAAVTNARATLALHAAGMSLATCVWGHRPAVRREPAGPPPTRTAESEALATTLRRAGFRFIGPTTAYALMQACGLVNDHRPDCPARAATEAAQLALAQRWQGTAPGHGR